MYDAVPAVFVAPAQSTTFSNSSRAFQELRGEDDLVRVRGALIRDNSPVILILTRPGTAIIFLIRVAFFIKTQTSLRITNRPAVTATVEARVCRSHPLLKLIAVDKLKIGGNQRQREFILGGNSDLRAMQPVQLASQGVAQLVLNNRPLGQNRPASAAHTEKHIGTVDLPRRGIGPFTRANIKRVGGVELFRKSGDVAVIEGLRPICRRDLFFEVSGGRWNDYTGETEAIWEARTGAGSRRGEPCAEDIVVVEMIMVRDPVV